MRALVISLALHGALGGLAYWAIHGRQDMSFRPSARISVIETGLPPRGASEPAHPSLARAAPAPAHAQAHAPLPAPADAPSGERESEQREEHPNSQNGILKGIKESGTLVIDPHYPRASRAMGEVGTVVVRVSFLADGQASVATLIRSSGFARLDQAALDAARVSRLTGGGAGPREREFSIRFQLDSPL